MTFSNIHLNEVVDSSHPRNPTFWLYYSNKDTLNIYRSRTYHHRVLIDSLAGHPINIMHTHMDIKEPGDVFIASSAATACAKP